VVVLKKEETGEKDMQNNAVEKKVIEEANEKEKPLFLEGLTPQQELRSWSTEDALMTTAVWCFREKGNRGRPVFVFHISASAH
jgi:hypothetical protein